MNEQGTEEWLLERLGYVSASCFSDVMAKGQGLTRLKYMRRVVAERLTGKPMESYYNRHMERGHEQEPYARMAYEAMTGNIVQESGFIKHPTLMAGCSPDGLIDEDGGVEIKSVLPTVQIETMERGGYPYEHAAQIHGSLWITGRKWWDFVSYSPDMPECLRVYIYRVEPQIGYISDLEKEVIRFLSEAEEMQRRLINRSAA
jgi:hypothetical protein